MEQIGEQITRQSLERIAAQVNTASHPAINNPQSAILVFNPLSFPRADAVSVDIESAAPFDLLDETGTPIPYEMEGLGGSELVHAEMSPAELGSLYGNIRDGRVMGLSILGIAISLGSVTLASGGAAGSQTRQEQVAPLSPMRYNSSQGE